MILAFEGEAIFAVANFKEEGPTKEQKEKKYLKITAFQAIHYLDFED